MAFTEKDLLAITRSPGAQYLLMKGDSTLCEISTGLADVSGSRAVDAQTTFNAYSTTKTFTAAAVMQLVEQGKLSLEEKVNSHFPQWAFSHEFTLRQLLSHQAGIGNPLPLKWIHLSEEHDDFSASTFAKDIISRHIKMRFPPGSKAAYTNVGYLLLGLLIEKVSGTDYKAFITENIIKKVVDRGAVGFEMTAEQATGYHPRWSLTNLLITLMIDRGRYMKAAEGKWSPFKNHYVNGSAYGGLIANAAGLSSYLQALQDGSIVGANSIRELFTVQKDNICLGWYKGKLGSHSYFHHAGGGGGYYCEIRIYPQLSISSVMMSNRSGFSDRRLLDKIDMHFIP